MTTATTSIKPSGGLLRGFSVTYVRIDIKRILRNRRAMIFTLIMPTVLYLAFGAAQSYGNDPIGHANTKAYIMVHMAVYGAILATTTNAASVALEQRDGWTRTLRLTRLSPAAYVITKAIVAMSIAAMPLVIVSVIAFLTGARAPIAVYVGSLVLGWVGSVVFAAFGLALGSALKSEAAMQASGGILTILAFIGNVFIPLKGTVLTFSMFTPMFGVSNLANYPITNGDTPSNEHIALWIPIANLIAWGLIMGAIAVYFYRRSTDRQ